MDQFGLVSPLQSLQNAFAMPPLPQPQVRVGLCAWTDKGLIDLWYPRGATPETRLRFYAEHFDVVEVNSSYYAIPEAGAAGKWVARTPGGFIFHVKAFGYMTGHRVLPEQLPPDLRPLVERVSNRGFVEPTAELTRRVFSRFREAVEPLRQAGKLGGILMQYGPTVRPSPESAARIEADRDRLAGLEMLIEFRHVDWLAVERREETLALVRRLGLTYVAVDAPAVTSPNVAQTVVRATSSTAYVRFHGRNAGHGTHAARRHRSDSTTTTRRRNSESGSSTCESSRSRV